MKYQELEEKVIIWAENKGILDNGTPYAQAQKTLEEVEELIEAVTAQKAGNETFINSKGKLVSTREETIDAIGDVAVTLIIQCEMQGLSFEDCLNSAYNVISKRSGVMKDGQFIKDK